MEMYLNIANDTIKSLDEWIDSFPQELLSSGESWDSLIEELVNLGLFVPVSSFKFLWDPSPLETNDVYPTSAFDSFAEALNV